MVLEDDNGCVDKWGEFPAAWVQVAVVGARSRDRGTCASGMAPDAQVCVTAPFPRVCAIPSGCCTAVDGETFDGGSTNASARELEE